MGYYDNTGFSYAMQEYVSIVDNNTNLVNESQEIEKSNVKFTIVLVTVYTVSILTQFLALYVLLKSRNTFYNQRNIFISLCVTELLTLFLFMNGFIFKLAGVSITHAHVVFVRFLRLAAALQYSLTMHHIAIDRFLEVYLHLAYPIRITRQVINYVIASCWCISFIFAIIFTVLIEAVYSWTTINKFAFDFFFVTDVVFLITAFSVYSYLYVKYRSLRQKVERNNLNKGLDTSMFLAPTLIIATNVIFQATASFLSLAASHTNNENAELLRSISILLFGLGLFSDPLIYIFLQQSFRNVMRKRFHSIRKKIIRTRSFQWKKNAVNTNKPTTIIATIATVV